MQGELYHVRIAETHGTAVFSIILFRHFFVCEHSELLTDMGVECCTILGSCFIVYFMGCFVESLTVLALTL